MIKVILILLFQFLFLPTWANDLNIEKDTQVVKEVYKLQGQVEFDDNPVETIYLDENIEKPQVNIPKRTLTLPVDTLNITSNTNNHRSALARASVNRGSLKDILPLSGQLTEQLGSGFTYGQLWEQELSNFSQMESTTAFYVRYDTPRWFSLTTSMRQSAMYDIGNQYNIFRLAPEFHITDRLTLKDSFSSYMDKTRNRNEITLVYTPALKKYAESLKFELGVVETFYQTGRRSSQLKFSTGFKL